MLIEIKMLAKRSRQALNWKIAVFIWILLLSDITPFAWGAEKSAEVNSEVLAHRWSTIRLSNVDRGATLEINLRLDGPVIVVLVDKNQMKNYPKVTRPLFRTETRSRANFSVVIPKSGDYYLIVDNRNGATQRKYSLSIKAQLDTAKIPSGDPMKSTDNDPLNLLNRVIQTAFVVDPLEFKLTSCDRSEVYTQGETIFLCRQYLKKLKGQFEDKHEINEIVLFVLMREAGQVLLNRWKYPLSNNRNIRDELATTLLLMFGRRKAVEIQANYSTQLEPENKGRSETLKEWLNDPFVIKKWQPFLVQKMQTRYLHLLKKEEPSWTSLRLIDRELTRRK